MIGTITAWVSKVVTGLWTAFLKLVSTVLQFCADVLMAVLGWGLDQVLVFLLFVVGLLPKVPELPKLGAVPALMVQANYFVPLDVAVACVGVVGVFYAASYVYKGGKFLRGGG